MRRYHIRRLIDRGFRVLAASAALAALAGPIAAQPPAGASAAAPDPIHGLNGSWERYPNRFSGLGSEPAEPVKGPPPPEAVPDPPLKPEYLKEWKAKQAEIAKLTKEGLPPANNYSACLPDGMPAMMQAMFPMEVLETPGQVTVIEEAFNQVRRIYLGEQPLSAQDAEPRFWGHSAGKWEGGTLVVETVGIKEDVQYRNVPHSMNMRIVERIRLMGNDFMQDQVTVHDPDYLTQPWTWTWMYRRWPGYKIQEYVCEDNRYTADPVKGNQKLRLGD
jgi:hypothetical protein